MAKAPHRGHAKTRLARAVGDEGAARLAAAMLEDSLDSFRRLDAERFVLLAAPEHDGPAALRAVAPAPWEVHPQVGDGLQARLVGGLLTYGHPSGTTLFLGSDSPTLPCRPVDAWLAAAAPGRALLVPALDGGYCLIAVPGQPARVFEGVPWSTPQALAATKSRCVEAGLGVDLLPEWYDVDDEQGLARLRAELHAQPEWAPRCAEVLEADLRTPQRSR